MIGFNTTLCGFSIIDDFIVAAFLCTVSTVVGAKLIESLVMVSLMGAFKVDDVTGRLSSRTLTCERFYFE